MATIRAARSDDANAIAHCHISAWRDTYRPIVAEEYLNSLSYENHIAKWEQKLQQLDSRNFVAEDERGDLVGFITGGPERTGHAEYKGEIYAIYLLKECRRQGIGRKLFERLAVKLHEMQINSLIVWAFQDNECRHCYAAWGGKEIAVQPIKVGNQELLEVAYGWKDLEAAHGQIAHFP